MRSVKSLLDRYSFGPATESASTGQGRATITHRAPQAPLAPPAYSAAHREQMEFAALVRKLLAPPTYSPTHLAALEQFHTWCREHHPADANVPAPAP